MLVDYETLESGHVYSLNEGNRLTYAVTTKYAFNVYSKHTGAVYRL